MDKFQQLSNLFSVLPGTPPQPCPEVLTEEEAIKYLRLDEIEIANAADTLRYYRKKGLLLGTQIGTFNSPKRQASITMPESNISFLACADECPNSALTSSLLHLTFSGTRLSFLPAAIPIKASDGMLKLRDDPNDKTYRCPLSLLR